MYGCEVDVLLIRLINFPLYCRQEISMSGWVIRIIFWTTLNWMIPTPRFVITQLLFCTRDSLLANKHFNSPSANILMILGKCLWVGVLLHVIKWLSCAILCSWISKQMNIWKMCWSWSGSIRRRALANCDNQSTRRSLYRLDCVWCSAKCFHLKHLHNINYFNAPLQMGTRPCRCQRLL